MVRARRSPLALVAGALIVAVGLALVLRQDSRTRGAVPTVPAPRKDGQAVPDPFAWAPGRAAALEHRAAAGTAHLLYVRSPGGALATAERTARWRPQIERAAKTAGVDADRLEALVFLESAGRPDALTAGGIEGAAGLTQILAQTGSGLLAMRVDTARSARYTRRLERAIRSLKLRRAAALSRARRRVDERFDPVKALAATGRYLVFARQRLGREDLAFVSYHMGVGNLQSVLRAYGGGRPSYAQLYFDSTPARHPAAYRRLQAFGDDSSNYYWKLGAAEAIMRLYRTDRAALTRTAALQTAAPSAWMVLHPPPATAAFRDAEAVEDALGHGALRALPSRPDVTGLRAPPGAALRPAALALALYIGAAVHALAGGALDVTTTTRPGDAFDPHAGGWTFDVARRYASRRQALAFQYVLDRLQVLNAIAWTRDDRAIHVTVAPDAAGLEPLLDRLSGSTP